MEDGKMTNETKKVRLTLKKIDGEFIVQYKINGKRIEDADYYADEKEDAVETMRAMARDNADQGHEVSWREPKDYFVRQFACVDKDCKHVFTTKKFDYIMQVEELGVFKRAWAVCPFCKSDAEGTSPVGHM